jgi:hypothetical protein
MENKLERISLKLTQEFWAEIDRLDAKIVRTIETETERLSQGAASLREETQQNIQTLNKRVDTVNDSVNKKLNMHMSETKQVQEKLGI